MAATQDQKILFTALGFTAVILSGAPKDKQAQRALAMARLIEDFCMAAVGEETEAVPAHPDLFAGLINDNNKSQTPVRDAMSTLERYLQAAGSETPGGQSASLSS